MLNSCEPNRNIFQIYLSDDDALPVGLEQCTQTIASNRGDYQHRIAGGKELRSLLETAFSAEIVRAYDSLVPYSYKADLGRFCLLFKFGGWYMDITVTLTHPLPVLSGIGHIAFKDAPWPNQHAWETSTSVIYACAGSKVMEAAIGIILDNCRNEYYGTSPLDPTGPGVLGRALAIAGPDNATITGMYLPLTPQHAQKNFAFVLPDGRILAWGKKTHGTPLGDGLAHYGATGTNSYTELYKNRMIYRKIQTR